MLDTADISKEHASLRWTGAHWELRDLNSRNGTFVGTTQLGSDDNYRLAVGDRARFGSRESWRVVEVTPPPPMARHLRDGTFVVAQGHLLTLPSEADPQASVYRHPNGLWQLETTDQIEQVQSGAVVDVGEHSWRLLLAEASLQTAEPVDAAECLADSELSFEVSKDEEHVVVRINSGALERTMQDRAHHYVTLTLARLRLRDVQAGLPPSECGWVHHADLQSMLGTSRNHLNVAVHRIRKQLEELGYVDAANIVERRRTTGQLRIGLKDLAIAIA